MVNNNKAIKDFLDNVSDEKLKNFVLGEKTIVESKKFGFRLDHQGDNSDGSDKDRLASQLPTNEVVAQIHVTDPGDPKEIRDALCQSFKSHAKFGKLA